MLRTVSFSFGHATTLCSINTRAVAGFYAGCIERQDVDWVLRFPLAGAAVAALVGEALNNLDKCSVSTISNSDLVLSDQSQRICHTIFEIPGCNHKT